MHSDEILLTRIHLYSDHTSNRNNLKSHKQCTFAVKIFRISFQNLNRLNSDIKATELSLNYTFYEEINIHFSIPCLFGSHFVL